MVHQPQLQNRVRRRGNSLRRRTLLALAAATLPAARLTAQERQVPHIGMMAPAPPTGTTRPMLDAFTAGLAEQGYAVGRDVVLDFLYNGGVAERIAEQAAEFVRMDVALIVAPSTQTAIAARRATETLPIVIVAVGDPVGAGLAASLARPGGNVTGMTSQGVDFATKHLELLKEAVPNARRMAVLLHPENQPHKAGLAQLRVVSPVLGVEVTPIVKRVAADIEPAFERAVALGCEAMIVFDDAVTGSNRLKLVELSAASRLPAIYQWRFYVTDGGLMAFGPSLPDLFRGAGSHAARILRGDKPAELPIEQPTRFELVVNAKTARALGLVVPQSLLVRADEVIE